VAELVAYLPYMAWLIQHHGLEGAAIAWVIRVAISTLALWIIAGRCLSGSIKTKVH
jgi:O-antigen/teichoic acid export membrane protein